jgi:hypothetical protein
LGITAKLQVNLSLTPKFGERIFPVEVSLVIFEHNNAFLFSCNCSISKYPAHPASDLRTFGALLRLHDSPERQSALRADLQRWGLRPNPTMLRLLRWIRRSDWEALQAIANALPTAHPRRPTGHPTDATAATASRTHNSSASGPDLETDGGLNRPSAGTILEGTPGHTVTMTYAAATAATAASRTSDC